MIRAEIIDETIALISKSDVNYEYFFKNLTDVEWIQPLRDRGYFKSPPVPIENERSIHFPIWPESQFLLRMVEVVPELVIEIATELPPTENERVHEDFTQAACKVDPNLAVKWAKIESDRLLKTDKIYLNQQYYVTDLIVHLSGEDTAEEALGLAKALFDLRPDPEYEKRKQEEKERSDRGEEFIIPYSPEPRPLFDRHGMYDDLLGKCYPVLSEILPKDTFLWLGELLIRANQLSRGFEEEDDASCVWRPSIADDPENNTGFDVRDKLVDAVRDVALELCRTGDDGIELVLQTLEREEYRRWSIFRRLLLHLYEVVNDIPNDVISATIKNNDVRQSYEVSNEYWRLVRAKFGILGNDEKSEYIESILSDKGAEKQAFVQRFTESKGEKPTEGEINSFLDRWTVEELHPLKEYLTGDALLIYNDALSRVSEYSINKMPFRMKGGFKGPRSPIPSGDISEMSLIELTEYLITWEPEEGFDSPTRDGMATALSVAVRENPGKYLVPTETLPKIHPTFVRGIIEGFLEASRADSAINWEEVLNIFSWISNQDREFTKEFRAQREDRFREDLDWGWTRSRILDLLQEGLKQDRENGIQFDKRDSVWDIIKILSDDPNPSAEEKTEVMEPFDAPTASINTVRGRAMHTCMYYTMWVRNALSAQKGVDQSEINFSDIEEVGELLSHRLDTKIEPTLTIRSVYGRWLPYLITWDQDWSVKNLPLMLPKDAENQKYRDIAWATYVVYNRPYNNVYPILAEEYNFALTRLGKVDINLPGARSVDESLAQHILIFYARGIIDLAIDGLVAEFYRHSSPELRRYFIEYAGELLASIHTQDMADKFTELWEWWTNQYKESNGYNESAIDLPAFGKWLVKSPLSAEWILKQIGELMENVGSMNAEEEAIDWLAKQARETPLPCIQIFKWLNDGDKEPWTFYTWKEPLGDLLQAVLAGSSPDAKGIALEVIDGLIKDGYLEFRHLLKGMEH
ncbi:MAG: hypothetical protein K9N29_03140 [Candidatus Marinimicrobia bacterium]|nr:hypothetical protein [Candidatus Neomarinimicrobiota bacterium]